MKEDDVIPLPCSLRHVLVTQIICMCNWKTRAPSTDWKGAGGRGVGMGRGRVGLVGVGWSGREAAISLSDVGDV